MAIKKVKAPEFEEKKEKFLEKIEPKPAAKKRDGPPLYLLALLVVLGILIGLAAYRLMQPPQQPVLPGNDANSGNEAAYRTVPVIMIYSSDCKRCRQTNTTEDLLRVRQIPYQLTLVDANSEQGRVLVEKFGVTSAPTALIDSQKLAYYPATKSDFDRNPGIFRKVNGMYVAPEVNLNDNMYYPVYYLQPTPGFCFGTKPTVVQFDDFYNPMFTLARKPRYDFLADFNTSINMKFSLLQQASAADSNAILGNVFLMCASQQGNYQPMERSMAAIYCNPPGGDGTEMNGTEVQACNVISQHYGKSLTQFELDLAVRRSGLDQNSFLACYDTADVIYNNARNAARDLGLLRAGTFLVDCRETTDIAHLRGTLCAMHPGLAPCSSPTRDTNAGA